MSARARDGQITTLRGAEIAREILQDLPADFVQAVAHAIEAHRYRVDPAPRTLEAQVVSDADKLDAIGAIGVARVFAHAGSRGTALWRVPWRSLSDGSLDAQTGPGSSAPTTPRFTSSSTNYAAFRSVSIRERRARSQPNAWDSCKRSSIDWMLRWQAFLSPEVERFLACLPRRIMTPGSIRLVPLWSAAKISTSY